MSTELKQHYTAQYSAIKASLPGMGLSWLNTAREKALANFSESGFPSPREEEWRYTNIAPIERRRFSSVSSPFEAVDRSRLKQFSIDGAASLVFVNGRSNRELSVLPEPARGIIACSMAEALELHADRVREYFAGVLNKESNGFLAFNTALFTDGAFVYVPQDMKVASPVHLIFVSTGADGLSTTRNLVIAGPGSQAEIIESYIGSEESGYLSAAVSELVLAEQADIRWSKLQCESNRGFHFGGLYADVGRYGRLNHANFSFGGLLARNEVHVDLSEASECSLDGLFLCTGRQHVDHHTRICHREAHGFSRESYKGILDQRARGVFQGRIIVARDAQKTDAEMSNRNLLLSSDAEIDSKPQLEIYADDVKCAHGVTVGQLDEQSVFYLRSRGVDRESARNMLTFAFANEMVEKVKRPGLRSVIQAELLAALPQTGVRKEWL
ncbi:MAG: Fe-S cluster assembly protein SufD [Methylococcaceae bacterium]|nr:Fe-S cluster assembly protein SufD [Methylococcaceae bacterium]MCI0732612.1 Fe-S cluster assembly protein SufD [Methylococcaceae bacterium]